MVISNNYIEIVYKALRNERRYVCEKLQDSKSHNDEDGFNYWSEELMVVDGCLDQVAAEWIKA